MNNEVQKAAWGNSQQPKPEYDWMIPEIEELFGAEE